MSRWQFVPRQKQSGGIAAIAAVVLALVFGAVVLAAVGASPLAVYKVFFIDPFSSSYTLAEIANKTVTLAVIALALAIGFRANVWNIGAEGQFTAGAVAASFAAVMLIGESGRWAVFVVLFCGILGGMLWAVLPALLRAKVGVNEILTSLMMVYVALLMLSYVVHGPLKDPQGFNFPQSPLFDDSSLVPLLVEKTRLFATALVLPPLALFCHWFMRRSWYGFEMRVIGLAPRAGGFGGMRAGRPVWISFLLAGAFAGLMGAAEVAGPAGQLTPIISPGYGFTAIIVAFLGRLHPLGIIGAAVLMATIQIGGENGQIDLALPASIAGVFQGLILFSLLAADFAANYRIRRRHHHRHSRESGNPT
ncbi:MAG: ABC transporter permease [Gammaproteobacteria bacterium]